VPAVPAGGARPEQLAAKSDGRVRFVKVNVDTTRPGRGVPGCLHPDVLLFVSGHVAGSSLGAKPATALERDLGLTTQGEQAEPADGRTGRPRLRRSIQARWNGS
jgi:thioredoxin-like negative regulator of GroEL